MKWIIKCKKIKNGLKNINPNTEISNRYLKQSENTLKRVKQLIDEEGHLWASVMTYYSAYYAIYAFLQKIGIKSENHSCSIEIFNYLTGEEELTKNIKKFRDARIDSQYYLILSKKEEINKNYTDLKDFYIELYNLCNSTQKEINYYLEKVSKFF
ncbi:HEPN domain-containing protein [Candidatus Woesearchaeota archaeon]|nr:HEPN domain-containing protein [Candidatus Woesearchaeota archaeon]